MTFTQIEIGSCKRLRCINVFFFFQFVRKTESVTETKPRSSTPDMLNSPTTTTDIMTRSMSPKPTHIQDSVQRPALTTGQVVALMADMDKLVAKVKVFMCTGIKPYHTN